MTSLDDIQLRRVVISAVGAATLSAICVLGAVVPAMAAGPTTSHHAASHSSVPNVVTHPSAR